MELLGEYAADFSLEILGYCLMPNHVHLIVVPHQVDALAKTLGTTHRRYAQIFNLKNQQSGHLWQGRFYSCLLDDSHLVSAMRYIERNPVRAEIAANPWDFFWSSAAAHTARRAPQALLSVENWSASWPPELWESMIAVPDDPNQMNCLRHNTHTGRPLGSAEFIDSLEVLSGKRLSALPVGRPKIRKK
jgi:putative transposase